jgi:hypothetical protein
LVNHSGAVSGGHSSGPVLIRKRALPVAAAFLMGAFALIGSFSIGLLYLPAAIVMFLAIRTPTALR